MTTRVHVVNLGPDIVEVENFDPMTSAPGTKVATLYSGDSINGYVHDSQSIKVSEKKKQ